MENKFQSYPKKQAQEFIFSRKIKKKSYPLNFNNNYFKQLFVLKPPGCVSVNCKR